ncbi:MAG TPA: hypothetical protein VM432_05605, partial [Bdellovibrionales bacterium]|nr:hypothetical protein [Bdellovibrionales bacterium]
AVLLGNQQLKVEAVSASSTVEHCASVEPANANAVVILKDASGKHVYRSEIRVGQFDFYMNKDDRGGIPAKNTAFIFSYPVNEKTAKAVTIELQLKGREYRQSAPLKTLLLGMK